jgi:hypothetical protein
MAKRILSIAVALDVRDQAACHVVTAALGIATSTPLR